MRLFRRMLRSRIAAPDCLEAYTSEEALRLVRAAGVDLVLLSLEIAAIVLLFGAQVIAEYERIGKEPIERPPKGLRT